MAASVQFRPQNRDLGMVMREVDEDLAIFLGMRNAENDRNDLLLLQESNEFDGSKGIEPNSEADIVPIAADDNLLNLETETSDYSWFLTQPDSFLPPSVDADMQDSAAYQTEITNGECIPLKSKLESTVEGSASPTENPLQLETISSSPNSSIVSNIRSSSSGERKPTPRAPTPTARSSLPSKSKPSRASTPSSRATLPSSKPVSANARSSTPTRSASRSSTPSSRPSVSSKSTSRSATPTTRKPATNSLTTSSDRGRKTGPTLSKNQFTSPTVKSRPSNKPSEMMLSVSQNAPQSSKVSMPRRPASATRVRANSSFSNGNPRQKSCSPPKTRVPIVSSTKIGSRVLSRSRGYGNDGDDVNPVLMGTKMVDRVVNMRKLAPPKQDEYVPHDNPKKSSQDNSGFGRSLSKKSLDMAIRHMDIRRSIPDKLRPGGRSGSGKNSPIGISESSLTSSCDSSK